MSLKTSQPLEPSVRLSTTHKYVIPSNVSLVAGFPLLDLLCFEEFLSFTREDTVWKITVSNNEIDSGGVT